MCTKKKKMWANLHLVIILLIKKINFFCPPVKSYYISFELNFVHFIYDLRIITYMHFYNFIVKCHLKIINSCKKLVKIGYLLVIYIFQTNRWFIMMILIVAKNCLFVWYQWMTTQSLLDWFFFFQRYTMNSLSFESVRRKLINHE